MHLNIFLEHLLEKQLLSRPEANTAITMQQESGINIFDALSKLGAIEENTLVQSASAFWGISELKTKDLPQDSKPMLLALEELDVPVEYLQRSQALVFKNDATEKSADYIVGARNPLDPSIREFFETTRADSQSTFEYCFITQTTFEAWSVITALSSDDASRLESDDIIKLRELAEEGPIKSLVDRTFADAIKLRASDIHIEPSKTTFDIRFRVDGTLRHSKTHPKTKFNAVSTRLKLISKMDIAESRLPQDGRQPIKISGKEFDLRVSSLPGTEGESIVMRLLPKNRELPSFEDLGISGPILDSLRKAILNPNGIILITGPTGSGKSTTLYRTLSELNDGQRKIITIEDPVEYDMEGIVQTQAKPAIGLTFANGLRSILRQDPDTIMIGEIRDGETASIAVQASLTGHLVLSTLHTNTALGAILRLQDLGLDSFVVGSGLTAVGAQRLVKRLCTHCCVDHRDPSEIEQFVRQLVQEQGILQEHIASNWKEPVGCELCGWTGYLGRVAVLEFIYIDHELRSAIMEGASIPDLEQIARKKGIRSLAMNALEKASHGVTSKQEVMGVIYGNE